MVFNSSMRFITSLPASEGKQVHIQLAPMPDCGVSPLSQLLAETAGIRRREHPERRPGRFHGARADHRQARFQKNERS